MPREVSTPIEEACHSRYPAWTLYARAFSGSRDHADRIVRGAVSDALRLSATLSTEDEAHDHVLRAIRASALTYNERQRNPEATLDNRAESVLHALRSRTDAAPSHRSAETVHGALDELPRGQHRVVEMLLLRRPPLTIRRVAERRGTESSTIAAVLADALATLAARFHRKPPTHAFAVGAAGEHVEVAALLSYVHGALSGDEALDVIDHCEDCAGCGDALGMMMLLKSNVAAKVRLPRLSRETRIAAVVCLAIAVTLGGAFAFQTLRPNPWAEYATQEPVPTWFHQFFYGGDRDSAGSELSRALLLLVEEDYEQAIETLEPLLERPGSNLEAASYLGIARYLSGNVSRRTVALLQQGTQSHRSGRLARWYLASTHLARRDIGRAREQLDALANVRDWFGRAAEALLEQLDQLERGGASPEPTTVAGNGGPAPARASSSDSGPPSPGE